uniref:ATP synthase complex subunit 8 n=1 Tax=Lepidodactylus lugubris TaxID=47724 RepID=A0A0A1H9W4_LEPLU|nr:ATP synthase F0 subunit 8 [Lepidodactylus lugubris]BAP90300.1 ATPase subunit 8 [Lepidodactylus lugubris]
MPQLNPAPWFVTFLITWLIILALLKPMLHMRPIQQPVKDLLNSQTTSWLWTWH